jgi:hypothetical protein
MGRAALAPLRFLHRATTGLAVLSVASLTPAHAEEASSACKLLQVAEIESALGGKASKKPAGDSQNTPNMDLDVCSVEISGPGPHVFHAVSIIIVKKLPMDGGEAIRTRNAGTAREQQWKVAGARLEQKTVGSSICIMAGRPSVAGHSTCSIPRGKGYVEVDVTGPVEELVSLEKVGALVQKAVTRL